MTPGRGRALAWLIAEGILLGALAWMLLAPPRPEMLRWLCVTRNAHTARRVVALTFDDGPHPVYTPQILALLDKYHAGATFFMIGQRMEEYPELVRAVAARGHVIGNHTFSHPHSLTVLSDRNILEELRRAEDVLMRLTGRRATLFRPPRGYADGALVTLAADAGYHTVLWTVCADNKAAPTPRLMADRVLRALRPGAVILIHDGQSRDRWKDVAATELILRGLQARGYRSVTLPELLAGP